MRLLIGKQHRVLNKELSQQTRALLFHRQSSGTSMQLIFIISGPDLRNVILGNGALHGE